MSGRTALAWHRRSPRVRESPAWRSGQLCFRADTRGIARKRLTAHHSRGSFPGWFRAVSVCRADRKCSRYGSRRPRGGPARPPRQVGGSPAANRSHEVGEMGRFQFLGPAVIQDVLDLVALLIKDRSAGSVAGEVTALAVDHQPAGSVPELAHGVRRFGDPHVADLTDDRGGLIIQQRNLRVRRFAAVLESKTAPDAHASPRRLVLSRGPSAKVYDM